MSDYSNLKIKQVDDLPERQYRIGPGVAKALAPGAIMDTLPFMNTIEVGQTMEIEIPEDDFGYKKDKDVKNRPNRNHYSLRGALSRTLSTLSRKINKSFVYRIVDEKLYIKRVD